MDGNYCCGAERIASAQRKGERFDGGKLKLEWSFVRFQWKALSLVLTDKDLLTKDIRIIARTSSCVSAARQKIGRKIHL